MASRRRVRRYDGDAPAVERAHDREKEPDARDGGATPRAEALRSLQRRIGNRAVERMLLDPSGDAASPERRPSHKGKDGAVAPQFRGRAATSAPAAERRGAAENTTSPGRSGSGAKGIIARSVKTAQVPPAAATAGRKPRGGRSTEARRKIGLEKVAANATAMNALGGDYGITWPQQLRLTLGAKLQDEEWVLTVSDVIAEYSVQARILGHQADITSDAVATALNYQALIDSLDTLGVPGGTHNWYSLKAVKAHESRHATRALQALMDVREEIEATIADVTIARANNRETAQQAVALIIVTPEYGDALDDSFDLWDARFDALITGDHTGSGPCEDAERSITVPLKEAILAKATQQRWIAPPQQIVLPT